MRRSVQDEIGRLNQEVVQKYLTGDYEAALSLATQAAELGRRALGEEHPSYAASLNNLAGLYVAMGNHAGAEPLLRQALEIRRRALGEEHSDYAASLNNLALLHQDMGNHARAEPLFLKSLEINRRALGEEHPTYALSLHNLAALYYAMGNHAEAEAFSSRALEIRRLALGEEHPSYAASLNNLAGLYQDMGNHAGAEPLYRQALEINRRALGEEHPSYATSLHNLAGLYHAMGNYARAEPLYQQALEITRRALGEEHPAYATSLNSLAGVCAATERTAEALSLMRQAAAVDDRMIGQVFSIGSEAQRTAFLATVQPQQDSSLSLVFRYHRTNPEAVAAALDLVLRRKAIRAEALATQHTALLGGRYPDLAPQFREWTVLRAQIARKTLDGPGPEGLEEHRRRLAGWEQEKDRLEADLARSVPEMNLEHTLRAADRRAVALALPPGAALVEFVRFDVVNFQAVPARGERQSEPARYLAFVLPAGEPERVRMVDLGEAEPLDVLIRDFRRFTLGEGEGETNRDLGAAPAESGMAPDAASGTALRAALFDPLRPALEGRTRLLLSPDGDLTRLPFEVLPGFTHDRLIEEYQISYVSCGRDVLRFGAPTSGRPTPPLVLADPDFDTADGTAELQAAGPDRAAPAAPQTAPGAPARLPAPPGVPEPVAASEPAREGWLARLLRRARPSRSSAPAPISAPRSAPPPAAAPASAAVGAPSALVGAKAGPPGRRSRDLDRSHLTFGPLPGTRQEGEAIAAMLEVTAWCAGAALEGRVKGARSPRILHLATHGFFLADQERDPNQEFRDLGFAAAEPGGNSGFGSVFGRLGNTRLESPCSAPGWRSPG